MFRHRHDNSPVGMAACGAVVVPTALWAVSLPVACLEQDDEQDDDQDKCQQSTTDSHVFLLNTVQSSTPERRSGVRRG